MHSINIYTTRLHLDRTIPFHKRTIESPKDAADLIREALDLGNWDREGFGMIALDHQNVILGVHWLAIGNHNSVAVDIKSMVKACILNHARAIVMFHNHPNDSTRPSTTDIALTRSMRNGFRYLSLELADHLIVSFEKHLSMRNEGWFEEPLPESLFSDRRERDHFERMVKNFEEIFEDVNILIWNQDQE